jgi:hypothetical protein
MASSFAVSSLSRAPLGMMDGGGIPCRSNKEGSLYLRRRADDGQDRHVSVLQLGTGPLDGPRINAALLQKRADVCLVDIRRQMAVQGVGVIGSVADVTALSLPHDTQRAFFGHALLLSDVDILEDVPLFVLAHQPHPTPLPSMSSATICQTAWHSKTGVS